MLIVLLCIVTFQTTFEDLECDPVKLAIKQTLFFILKTSYCFFYIETNISVFSEHAMHLRTLELSHCAFRN